MRDTHQTNWLGLMIGNSRLHWAWFTGETLIHTWDTDYLPANIVQQLSQFSTLQNLSPEFFPLNTPFTSSSPLFLASVVPNQTVLWETYPNIRILKLDQVPIKGIYPTLGIDRALALYGAGQNWGFPMLVIDAGTALTFTAADANHYLVGGAILPGLGLQLSTLAERTGQLPMVKLPQQLPGRYALNTQEAMQSGVIYTLVAGIKDFIEAWWHDFPQGKIAIRGGDCELLVNYMRSLFPEIAARLIVEQNLIFWGMRSLFF
ncbi:pantothenate kinase [Nostocales cyanobacterium HT-58-2]|nr:pantothenate kinase [Nostocales cyanobacterium HT-58-2]